MSTTACTAGYILLGDLTELGLGAVLREYRFAPERRWRFDFAVPQILLAAEIEGGVWSNGRHTRGAGFQNDLDKYNCAVVRGWKLLRFSTQDVLTGKARKTLREWSEANG